ncbi:MAG TPA: DUF3499 family protein [Candidatus Lumbricidophila sp.]|nr:DUF3499 family protein [Candidatus Lumbricidophila sp.]
MRGCSRAACPAPAAATLTYDYSDSMMVVGPLSPQRDPHGLDLCRAHADRMNAPVGWQLLRLADTSEVGFET